MTTATEAIVARAHQVLLGAGIAGGQVWRDMPDRVDAAELPAVRVGRGGVDYQPFGAGVLRATVGIAFTLQVAGADRETALDALHEQIHAALLADSTLSALGKGLRPEGTDDPQDVAGDPADRARFTAFFIARWTARGSRSFTVAPGNP